MKKRNSTNGNTKKCSEAEKHMKTVWPKKVILNYTIEGKTNNDKKSADKLNITNKSGINASVNSQQQQSLGKRIFLNQR